jgi:hypothetical protein
VGQPTVRPEPARNLIRFWNKYHAKMDAHHLLVNVLQSQGGFEITKESPKLLAC